jgi:hypothetical protein
MADVEKIDEYVDRPAVADDTKFLTDQLKAVLELFEKVKATKITLNVATTLKETTEAAKETEKAMDKLKAGKEKLITIDIEAIKAIKEQVKSMKDLSEGHQDLIKQSVQVEIASKKLREARAFLNKAFKEGQITSEELAGGLEEIKVAEVELKLSNEQLSRALKNLEKDSQGAEGSLDKLRAQLNLSLQAFDALSAEEKNSDTGAALKRKIVEITEAVSAEEQATKRFQRNVGNYSGSANIIVEALERARVKFNDLSKAADTTPAALQRARGEFEALRQVTDSKQFLNFAGKIGDANAEVKFFTKQLNVLEDAGLKNEQVYKDVQKRLAALTDQIGDTRDEIKALASDTKTFDQFAGAVNFAADVFQTFAGVLALGTDNEKEAQEALKTLVAIQTISNGVKGIANELTTKGTAANKAYAFAQRQVALVMDETAASGTRLRAALITVGIGALIIGIGLLIANFDKVKRAITGVSKEQEAYNEVLKESDSEFTQAVKLVNQLKTNIDLAKQGFIQKEAVIKQYNDSIGKTTGQVKSLEQAEKDLIEKGDAYIQMTLAKAVANLALEQAAKKAFEIEQKRQKQAEEFLNTGDKLVQISTRSGSAAPGGFIPSNNNLEKEKELRKEQSEKRKKAAIKVSQDEEKVFLDIANNAQKRAAEIAKKFNLNIFDNNAAVQQTAKTKEFDDRELKKQADKYKKLSEFQDVYLVGRVAAREKANDLEREILDGQQKVEIDNINAQIAIERNKASIGEISKAELIQKEQDATDQKSKINKKYATTRVLLEDELNEDLLNIRQTFIAKQRELEEKDNADFFKDQEDKLKASVEAIQQEQERRLNNNTEGQQAEIEGLNKWYEKRVAATREGSRKRNKVDKEYAEKRAEIEYQYSIATLKNEIDTAEKIISVHKAAGINVGTEEKALHDLKIRLSDIERDHIINNYKKQALSHKEKIENTISDLQLVQGIESQVADVIGSFINNQAEAKKNATQQEIDDIDKKKEKEIEAVNASSASEQEKANKIAIINARADAQKDALERKKRQVDLQRARFEKAKAIADIILKTAIAVLEGLIQGGPPLAIAYGAIGAAELAVAIATPLPKFKHGREDGPATWGVTGDGGKHEVLTSPDLSQAFVTPDTDTLTYLPKSWKVFPDVDKFREAAVNMAHKPLPTLPIINHNNNDGLIRAMAYEIGGLKRAIMSKQETHFHWNQGELEKAIKNGNDTWRYIQRNV